MLTKSERLGDNRNPRQLSNRKDLRAARRERSKLAVQAWKDWKADKRFALCALAKKYENLGYFFAPYISAPLHEIEFAEHPAIPPFAFRYAAAHPSKTDAAKIACYPTLKDAKRGREIVMAPGRFFAAVYPNASASEIQRMAEKYAMATAPASVHFAKHEDDFSRVYASARGFSSCMAGEWEGEEDCNPVRFYGHPDNDLSLAYLTHNNKPGGETVARSIVNTAKKCYVRIYGDARLETLLENMGYSCDGYKALNNQKCHARTINGDLVAPYLDAIQSIDWDKCSDYCRISEGGYYQASETDGTAMREHRQECENCGDEMDEDDGSYSDYHDMTICSDCADCSFTYAIYNRRGDETYVRDNEIVHVNGQAYLNDSDVLSAHSIVIDHDGEAQSLDDCIFLEYLEEYVLIDSCTHLDIPFCGDEYARDCDIKIVTIDDEEKTVHEDYEDDTADPNQTNFEFNNAGGAP